MPGELVAVKNSATTEVRANKRDVLQGKTLQWEEKRR
jgi:hypothetical protein